MANPHIEQHIAAEMAFCDNDLERALARDRVKSEYAGMAEYDTPCSCGGTLSYRATIGALKCPDCGQLAHTDGTTI